MSLAALELLVHTDADLAPPELVAAYVDIPDSVAVKNIEVSDLPRGWRGFPAPDVLQNSGRQWIEEAATVALSVPSAIIPVERNVVLNPSHSDFAAVLFGVPERFTFDPRLWRRG